MNKKILMSLGVVLFVAALSITATGAFFSDSEKSTGNTFTAGTLDLTVDSQSHYDGLVCVPDAQGSGHHWEQDLLIGPNPTSRPDLLNASCDGTWTQKDLGPSDKFFNFTDVKPGDNGEDTISLHTSNNAWVCANITTTSNNDNTVIAPEIAVGDSTTSPAGELAQNTFLFGWVDSATSTDIRAGDNKWQPGEPVLFQPVALSSLVGSSTLVLPLADSKHGSALIASTTNYIGLAWCTGTMDVSVPGTVKCDGSTLGNIIQTDSATADITLTATQSRNNPDFLCNQATTTPASLTVTKHVVHSGLPGDALITAADFDMHVKDSIPSEVTGSPQVGSEAGVTFNNLVAGATYTISENGPITVPNEHVDVTYSVGCSSNTMILAAGSNTCTVTNTYVSDI